MCLLSSFSDVIQYRIQFVLNHQSVTNLYNHLPPINQRIHEHPPVGMTAFLDSSLCGPREVSLRKNLYSECVSNEVGFKWIAVFG
jgi:hypothetical protein